MRSAGKSMKGGQGVWNLEENEKVWESSTVK